MIQSLKAGIFSLAWLLRSTMISLMVSSRGRGIDVKSLYVILYYYYFFVTTLQIITQENKIL
jgi:hypothetical protein